MEKCSIFTLGELRRNSSVVNPGSARLSQTPPSRERLLALLSMMGVAPRDLLRRKGTPYDELGLDDPALSDDQLIDAMMAHPILINRPIVVTDKGARLCRPSERVLDILENPVEHFTREDGKVIRYPGAGR